MPREFCALSCVGVTARLFWPGDPGKLQNSTFSSRNLGSTTGTHRMIHDKGGLATSAMSLRSIVRVDRPAQATGRPASS